MPAQSGSWWQVIVLHSVISTFGNGLSKITIIVISVLCKDLQINVIEDRIHFLKFALEPTHKALRLGSKLFALLGPSFLLAGQTADQTGSGLHLVPAALSILQQCLKGRVNRSVG